MTAPPALRFGILGPMTVTRGHQPLDAGSPRQRAVLALLLIDVNRPVSPDRLIDALWGDAQPRTATATLQAYISNLRRILDPDAPARERSATLKRNGAGYQLTAASDQVDSLEFAALVDRALELGESSPAAARPLLGRALDLWRGPALADFAYDDFAQGEIARLEEMRLAVLEQRIATDLALGRAGELIAELDRLVTEHPLRERLWGQLMLALYRSGRQAEALRAYRTCEQALAEVGLGPSTDLRTMEQAILDQDPRLHLRGGTEAHLVPTVAVDPPQPLVGRTSERSHFDAVLARARQGRGGVVLFEGEAGIGKTRLLEALEFDARAGGVRTAFARCVEVGGSPPFWPWIQLLRQLGPDELAAAAGPQAAVLSPLLDQYQTGSFGPGPTLFRLAEVLVRALQGLAGAHPLLLVIDDLYSADPDSLTLLTLVAAGLGDTSVVVLGSHRAQDLGGGHPLTAALTHLIRFGWVERRTLARFDYDEVGRLVSQVTGTEVDDRTVRTIAERTGGNALFAVELTRLLAAERSLEPGPASSAVPATIREVMSRRLDELGPDAVRLIRAGAVCGREFDLAVAAEVGDLEPDASLLALGEGLNCGLLAEADRPGVVRFTHLIVADSIAQPLGAVRRADLHARIADALERRWGHDPARWIEIAHHRRSAVAVAGHRPAIDALARGGRHALHCDALELAELLFEQRLELVLAEPPSRRRDRLEVESLLDLARVWTWREGYHAARVGGAARRLWELTGVEDGAELEPDTPVTSSDPVLSALMARFSFEIVSGDVDGAAEVAERFLRLAQRRPDPMVVFVANVVAMIVEVHAGRVVEAVAAAERAAPALEALDPHGTSPLMLPLSQQSGRATFHSFAGWAYWAAGNRERAVAELAAARAVADRLGHAFSRAFCLTVEGLVAAMDGSPGWVADAVAWGRSGVQEGLFGLLDRWRDLLAIWSDGMRGTEPAAAADRLREALRAVEAEGAGVVQTLYWGMAAQLELVAARPQHALEAAETGIARAGLAGERFWYPELERLRAEALTLLGRPREAATARRRARKAAAAMGIPLSQGAGAGPVGSLAGS